MAEAYRTYCMYCQGMICGVEILEEYPGVVVLYAYKACHDERRQMDPDATWKMLCESLQDLKKWPDSRETRAHAIDILEALAHWLRMGGFPPIITGGDDGKLSGARSRSH